MLSTGGSSCSSREEASPITSFPINTRVESNQWSFSVTFNQYKEWVRKNHTLLFSTEHLLSQLTWLAPNRFSESELQIETLHSILGLISWWHGILVADHVDKQHIWPLLLGVVRQVEGLIELIAINRVEKGQCRSKYPLLTKLEVLKFSLKFLSLLGIKYRAAQALDKTEENASYQSSRVLIDDGLPKENKQNSWQSRYQTKGHTAALAFERFYKTTKSSPSPQSSSNSPNKSKKLIGQTSLSKMYTLNSESDQLKSPKQINFEIYGDFLITISEFIHMSRPIAYLALTRRFGLRSWQPWIISLSFEGISRVCREISARCYSNSKVSDSSHYSHVFLRQLRQQIWSPEELQEFNLRDFQLLLYLMRSPCFDLLTRNVIDMSGRIGGSLPMLGIIIEKIIEILVGIQKYYTYTSGS